MKTIFGLILLFAAQTGFCQNGNAPATKTVLLDQLKGTFEDQEWFVPLHQAIQELTPAQASWKPDDSSHSIVQLVTHLYFWNLRALRSFNGQPNPKVNQNNDETFSTLRSEDWAAIVKRSDSLSAAWEKAVSAATNLNANQAQLLARVSTHNAYHTGQIMFVRKQEKAWDKQKGVQ